MEKIDYVIPMIFDGDERWRQDFLRSRWREYSRRDIQTPNWRSMGTEELLVRCIRTFLPFVGTIHILLARESQKQPWMDKYGIHVVYHREFIPERFLPTFNSRTIEMFLERIPGLSERFIYSNDDMFPVSPMQESDFFDDYKPCQHVEEMQVDKESSQFAWVCRTGTMMIARDFGKDTEGKIWLNTGHGVTPLLLDTYKEVRNLHKLEMDSSITPERDYKNLNQYIYVYFQHYAGMCADKEIPTTYTDNTQPLEDVVKAIASAKGIVCVNDVIRDKSFKEYASLVSEAIEKRLQSYLEKTNYGKGTEDTTAGRGSAEAVSVNAKQRRNGGDHTPDKKEIQNQVAEKRSTGKADTSAPAQERSGKAGKDNRKRGFRFNT